MSNFALNGIVIVAIWLLTIVKITYDQLDLFRLYKEKIDSSFPSTQSSLTIQNLIPIIKWRIRVIFKKYPSHPEVDKLANKVRRDLAVAISIFILLFVLSFFDQ